MTVKDRLTKTQLRVIDDLARGDTDLMEVLRARRVSRMRFRQWESQVEFRDALAHRIEWSYRRAICVIARQAHEAAMTLIGLTESEADEPARKACLDVLSIAKEAASIRGEKPADEQGGDDEADAFTPDQAERILAIMAENADDGHE